MQRKALTQQAPNEGLEAPSEHHHGSLMETPVHARTETETTQRQEGDHATAPSEQQAAPVNETGMPDDLKQGLEDLSGTDLSDVRVNYNSAKPAQLNALAYAQGKNIELGPGQEQHLPHEAWHVVQQSQGRVPATTETNGVAINDDPTLEREADVMGSKAKDIAH